MFKRLTPDEILIIVSNGLSLEFSAEGWADQDLADLLRVAALTGAHLRLRRIDLLSADQILSIGKIAPGSITFIEG